jgi:hypothetical protein
MAPRWARASDIECSRVTDLPAFARFAHDAAVRYPNVHYWEIWNEQDAASGVEDYYGCWGDPNDPWGGGGYYAQVLEAVYPAIKSANPLAKIVFGGLANAQGPYL